MSPSDAVVYLTVVEHKGWHNWFRYITSAPQGSHQRWQRAMFMCNTPSKVRLALANNNTTHHIDFSQHEEYTVGMNGEDRPRHINFFAYGRYTVLLVSCRGNDNPGDRIDISGRIQMLTETPSQIPSLFGATKTTETTTQTSKHSNSTTTLSHLGYGESIYPFVWSVVFTCYVLLSSTWLYILCKLRPLLFLRSRIVDSRLLMIAFVSLGCKTMEAFLKVLHYSRLSNGLLYWSSLPFLSSIMEAASSSCLLMLLSFGALGITIMRVHVHMREAVTLSAFISIHFITGLSQAFCRDSSSPTAAIPPSSSSSISTIVRNEYSSGNEDDGTNGGSNNIPLDQYYLSTTSCEILIFTEYVIQALVMLAIIIALNYNIAQLRQNITGGTWGRLTHQLYDKLAAFYIFRSIFMLYLLAPTLLLVIQIMILTWRYNWIMTVMIECTNISIYYQIHTAIYTTNTNPYESIKGILHEHNRPPLTRQEQNNIIPRRNRSGRSGGSGGSGGSGRSGRMSRVVRRGGSGGGGGSGGSGGSGGGSGNDGGSRKNTETSEGEATSSSSSTSSPSSPSNVLEIDMDW